MKTIVRTVTILVAVQLALADWQYRSRPDLAPPRLNITIPPTADISPGYLFVAPFAGLFDAATSQHGPRPPSPYIFRPNGDLVCSGYGYFSIWAANFQAARVNGQDVLFNFEGDHNALYGHGHGHVTFLDGRYETVRELRAGGHRLMDKHEFHVVGERTGLVQIYHPVPRNLGRWGGSEEQQWIVNALIQELDIKTGKLLFEWASVDHVSPDEAILPLNPGQAGSGYNSSDAWDYFHINSVDKKAAGDYLISARDACSVHKINGTTGEIIYRLDGKRSDFKHGNGTRFCFQHHARWLDHDEGKDVEIISLFDNSAHGTERGDGRTVRTAPTSSGKILRLNLTSWEVELVQGFYPPDGLLAKSQGSTQILPDGHALVNWGSEGAVTEFRADGTPIYQAYMDSGFLGEGVENYRAFKFNWTGTPNEDPAVVALESAKGTTVYVSWDGDTETKVWRFYEIKYAKKGFGQDEATVKTLLGEVERTSFETELFLSGRKLGAVSVEALNGQGKVLRSSGVVLSEAEVLPAGAGRGQWAGIWTQPGDL